MSIEVLGVNFRLLFLNIDEQLLIIFIILMIHQFVPVIAVMWLLLKSALIFTGL